MLIDPHTAVGIGAMKKISLKGKTIVLATAHPSKFYNVVLQETKIKPKVAKKFKKYINNEKEICKNYL